ncbi:transmembrane protein 145-like isoform X3 [Apostichopus japonicus]|uniref:transmembrane protein 145-like isoform X3 n=1 Tax=Stichopus japonicus TaxID=307972 RepID=UPI003AB136FD
MSLSVKYPSKMLPKWMCLWILLSSITLTKALYMEGELRTIDTWSFMARFCFLSEVGRLRFEVEYPKSFAVENLILYYDEADQWGAVYPVDSAPLKTCAQKESVLRPENHQIINLTTEFVWSGCISESMDSETDEGWISTYGDEEKFDCKGGRSFRSVRDRWWYLVIDNCESANGLVARYKLTMTNGDSFFRKHFSADQFGILETDMVMLVCYILVIFFTYVVASVLRQKQLLHTTYKMFVATVILYFLSLCCFIIFYFNYARTGTEAPFWRTTARIFQATSDAVFLLMLILMAKGYTITRGRLSHSGSIKITVLMAIYCLVYTALFIYEAVVFDPGEVLYFYESLAGFGLVLLRGLTWLWFIYAIFFTLKHYPEKSLFYVPFFFAYTLWFLAMPIMIIIATLVMPKWWREKAMNAIELSVALIAHTGFLILTRPSAANTNFPYHVRTSQIGCLMGPDGSLQNNVDGFSHHGTNGNVLEEERRATDFTGLFTVQYSSSQQSATANKHTGPSNQTPRPASTGTPRTDANITSLFQANGKQNGNNNVNM